MKIDSVNIVSFGGLKDFHLDFKDGMNIIYGDNEAGKSTIMAFIEMMFYGKTAQEKSTDISKSLRKRYAPWDGSAMCGELEFTYDNRRYRIHKVFKKTIKTDEVKLYDADTGNEIPLGRDEEIGQRFFG
ncbi:MAG: ATP-binding protein, partial [Lachnospiraceae bacterium]